MVDKKYQVSIITPFHDTDMNMFRNCAKGVFDQTLGFENIEWIVVVHNSGQEYIDDVHDFNVYLKRE